MSDITDERNAEAVREQVERICGSVRFTSSRKLAQFLRLIVKESLAGRGDQIKEYSIGLEIYSRPSGYDPRIDATVRVEATKLRKRLAEYYVAEGRADPILITIPKGRYVPVFQYAQSDNALAIRRVPWQVAVACLALLIAATLWWAFPSKPMFRISGMRLISSFPGSYSSASFSPDGAMIAFVAKTGRGAAQVWVKNLAHGDPLRITDGGTDAGRPRWSPKTDQIVFSQKGRGIWTVPPLGGPARRIVNQGTNPDFSPDGGQLVYENAHQIWIARTDGSDPRPLAGVPPGVTGIAAPAFSPDGRFIALFCRAVGPKGDLWVLPSAGGQPRRLTFDEQEGGDPTWTPDGQWIVFPSARSGSLTLWRVPFAGGKPEPVTAGVGEDSSPAISRNGKALIFTNARGSWRLLLMDSITGAQKELLSQRQNLAMPTFSPDGETIAFFQHLEADVHLFVIRVDGSGGRQVTRDRGQQNIMPVWAGDGKSLYFYQVRPSPSFRRLTLAEGASAEVARWSWGTQNFARVDVTGRTAVYTVSEGGRPKATVVRDLATGQEKRLAAALARPQWSRDGQSVLGSTADDRIMVCPVTARGCKDLLAGSRPKWSADGSRIYFFRGTERPDWFDLWSAASDGTHEAKITQLGPFSAAQIHFDLSSRGQVVWAPFQEGRQELWLAELRGAGKPN